MQASFNTLTGGWFNCNYVATLSQLELSFGWIWQYKFCTRKLLLYLIVSANCPLGHSLTISTSVIVWPPGKQHVQWSVTQFRDIGINGNICFRINIKMTRSDKFFKIIWQYNGELLFCVQFCDWNLSVCLTIHVILIMIVSYCCVLSFLK